MKIRNGDQVVVISGKDKGKTGTVLRVLPGKNRVVITNVNMRTRHMRATPQRPGQKVQYEASIHVSNVMAIDPKSKKRTRIAFATDAKGKKNRVAVRSGEKLTVKKAAPVAKDDVKTEEKAEKKTATKAAAKKTTKKTEKAAETTDSAMPDKKPFWKRVTNFGSDAADDAELKDPKHT